MIDKNNNVYNKEWLQEHYIDKRLSSKTIATILNVSNSLVSKNLTKFGIKFPSASQAKLKNQDAHRFLTDKEWLQREYQLKSSQRIANELSVTTPTVINWLKRHNIKLIKRTSQWDLNEEVSSKLNNKEWLTQEYLVNGKSTIDIAKSLGTSYQTVVAYLKKCGIKQRSHSESTMTREARAFGTLTLLHNKEWLLEQYPKKSMFKIAKEIGTSYVYVSKMLHYHKIDTERKTSDAEIEIREFISSLGFNVTTNNRSIIYPLELDIVIEEKKLAIEYCGLYWHSNENKPNNYHLDKLNKTNKAGYRLITIFEDEWIHKQELVKSKLKAILGKDDREKIFARKCVVGEVGSKEAKVFFESNHIQGNGNDSIRLGLYFKDELVACLSFKNKGDETYDLNRYATSKNVIGGFSKLLSHFKKNYSYKEITTFADRRWSEGNLYLKNGFELVGKTKPNYFYISNQIRESRIKYQKHKLSKILTSFDPSLTEIQNTEANGLLRIYDCGNMKFVCKKRF